MDDQEVNASVSGANSVSELREPPSDWYLTFLAGLAHDGIEIGVTLAASGTVVSGTLVSGRKFFGMLREILGNATTAEVGEALVKVAAEGYGPDAAAPKHFAYLHLANARYHAPGQGSMPNEGMLWRGRIAQVSGFSIGEFGPPPG